MKFRIEPKPRITISFMVLILSVKVIFGQILNGSFEHGSNPDLSHWEWTVGAESYDDAPAGGGNWSIMVYSGNTQGYLWGYAYQKIITAESSQPYKLSCWIFAPSSGGLYFGTINKGIITLYDGIRTSSDSWIKISVQSSFPISAEDTAIVVLDAGIAPSFISFTAFFDEIVLEPITGVDFPKMKQKTKLYPNPFISCVTFSYTLEKPGNVQFTVYNLQSQIVYMMQEKQEKGEQKVQWNAEGLPAGMYYFRLKAGDRIGSGKLVVGGW